MPEHSRGRCRAEGGRQMMLAANGWQRKFEDPISVPDGRKLITLRDAADYITSLPKKESDLPEWQTAIEVLMLVSRSGPDSRSTTGSVTGGFRARCGCG